MGISEMTGDTGEEVRPSNLSNRNYMSDVDIIQRFLIKTYNRLDMQCEVGVPEAISHLLSISDYYTEVIFEHLHISHVLRYVK